MTNNMAVDTAATLANLLVTLPALNAAINILFSAADFLLLVLNWLLSSPTGYD